MIEAVTAGHPLMAFRFALEHHEAILQRLDSFSAPTFLADLPALGGDDETLAAVRAYCGGEQPHDVVDACATVTSPIKDRIRIRTVRMPGVYSWLAANGR